MFSQAQFKKLGALGSKGEDYASCTRQEKPSPGPVAPVYRKRINVACLFRAKSGAAGVADAVQTAGGAALQPQPHGGTALSQHGGESWAAARGEENESWLLGGFCNTTMLFLGLNCQVWVQEHPYRQDLRGNPLKSLKFRGEIQGSVDYPSQGGRYC